MKIKPVLFTKHIHSCFAGWSSEDVWLRYLTTTKNINPVKGTIRHDSCLDYEVVTEIHENDEFIEVYLESDKFFYDRALHSGKGVLKDRATKEELAQKVKFYTDKGWSEIDHLRQLKALRNEKEKILERETNRMKGKIFFAGWSKDIPVEDYQGALSDELFNEPTFED